MKQVKKSKFALEKFEIAKLKNQTSVIGGTGGGLGGDDPGTVTNTSKNCNASSECGVSLNGGSGIGAGK